jgi:hypothetical protein
MTKHISKKNPKRRTTNMAKSVKVAGDLQVTDQSTFSVVLSFKDADGVPTAVPAGLTATYTPSDSTPGPSLLNITTPGSSGDQSTAAGTINQTTIAALVAAGTPLPQGLTITVVASWTGLASPQTVVAGPPIDLIPGPAASTAAIDTTP